MKAIINILTTTTSVTNLLSRGADGVYPGIAGKNAGDTYIVVNEELRESWMTKDAGKDYGKWEYTIQTWSTNAKTALELADKVSANLDNKTPATYNGHILLGSREIYRETLNYSDANRDNFGVELIFEVNLGGTQVAADSVTDLDSFTYSNNNQTVSTGGAITAMVPTVTAGATVTYILAVDSTIISGLTLASDGQITGTPAATGSFVVLAFDQLGNYAAEVVTVTVNVAGNLWEPSDLTDFSTKVVGWWDWTDSDNYTVSNNRYTEVAGKHNGGENLTPNTAGGTKGHIQLTKNGLTFGGQDGNPMTGQLSSDVTQECTLFFVVEAGPSASSSLLGAGSSPACRILFLFSNTSQVLRIDIDGSSTNSSFLDSEISNFFGDLCLYEFQLNTNNSKILFDAGETFNSGTISVASGNLLLNSGPNGGFALGSRQIGSSGESNEGFIFGEFIIVEGSLTTDERERFQGYLAHKFRIEDRLPAAHTYKANAPTT